MQVDFCGMSYHASRPLGSVIPCKSTSMSRHTMQVDLHRHGFDVLIGVRSAKRLDELSEVPHRDATTLLLVEKTEHISKL